MSEEQLHHRIPFDDILEHVGGCGRFQFFIFVMMTITMIFPSIMSTVPVMAAFKQAHHCRPREDLFVPGNGSLVFDSCDIYRNETPNLKVTCSEWDYDTSIFQTTIRSRYGLVCGWGFLAELSTSLFFLGFVIGSVVYGVLSDRFGRLTAIVITGTHLSAAGMAAGLAPNYWLYAFFRFLTGIGNGGLLASAFTYMAEMVTKDHRVGFCLMVHNGFSLGTSVTAVVGYLIRDSMWNQFTVAVPILIVWVYPLFLHESPRWLYTTGRFERAEKSTRFLARVNGKKFTDELWAKAFAKDIIMTDSCESEPINGEIPSPEPQDDSPALKDEQNKKDNEKQVETFFYVFRHRALILTTVINWFSWFSVSAGFFAVIYTLGDIGGNIFLNLFYGAIIEIPARVAVLFMSRYWGRMPGMAISLIAGAIGCFINAVLINFPSVKVGLQVVSVINKFWLTAAFDLIWAYSGELFPTVIRNVGVGVGSMWARIGGMLAPQVSLLFDVWLPLPLILMGALPFLAGLLCLLLPETLNKKMLETNEDMLRMVVTSTRFGGGAQKKMLQEVNSLS